MDDGSSALGRFIELGEGAGDEEGDAVAGGLSSAFGALEVDGFAGDDFGNEATFASGVGVEDPRHVLGGGADVGCHDIDFRTNEGADFLSKAAGEAFLFSDAHGAWVTGDSAFSAAVGEAHEGALPVHPHGEGGDFSDSYFGVEAEAAFDGATGEVVLDAVAEEDFGGSVIHGDRHGDGDDALGPFTAFSDADAEVEKVGNSVELFGGHAEDWIVEEILFHESRQGGVYFLGGPPGVPGRLCLVLVSHSSRCFFMRAVIFW